MRRAMMAGTAATVATAAMVMAAPASAGTPGPGVSLGSAGGFEYLRATEENVVTEGFAFAACDDKGDRPIGGGGTISGSGATAALNGSYPVIDAPPGHVWHAEGSTSGSPRTITSYAICDGIEFDYNIGNTALQAAGQLGDSAPISDSCASADESVLVGFRGDGGDVRFPASVPVPAFASWTSLARNFATESALLTQYARCFAEYDPKRRGEPVRIAPEKSGKVTARCKRSEAVITGGFIAADSDGQVERDAWVTSTRPFDSKDKKRTPDDGWTAKVQNASDGKVKLTVYAACQAK